MADITLVIMGKVPAHNVDSAEKDARRLRRGDIVDVLRANLIATKDADGNYRFDEPINSPRHVYIHVKNVPTHIARKIHKRITAPLLRVVTNPDPDIEDNTEIVRRKAWRIPPSIVPAAMTQKLRDEKEVTVTWSKAKRFIRKKIVANRLDKTQDDETTELNEATAAADGQTDRPINLYEGG